MEFRCASRARFIIPNAQRGGNFRHCDYDVAIDRKGPTNLFLNLSFREIRWQQFTLLGLGFSFSRVSAWRTNIHRPRSPLQSASIPYML